MAKMVTNGVGTRGEGHDDPYDWREEDEQRVDRGAFLDDVEVVEDHTRRREQRKYDDRHEGQTKEVFRCSR